MRFSAVFQLPLPARLLPLEQPAAARVEETPALPVAAAAMQAAEPSSPELPDDLDQRVRLVGEW